MSTGRQFVAAARAFLGWRYSTARPVNCSDGYVDCSGLVVCAARKVGVMNVATNSSGLARSMQAAGTLVELDKVGTIPGAILIRGPNHGYWGYGRLGHAAIDVGDGVRTIEIGSVRQPAHYGTIAGWRPSNYGMLPGLNYSVLVPAPQPVPIDVGDDVPQIIEQPMRPGEKPRSALKPQVAVLEKRRVVLLNGASMAGDRKDGSRRVIDIGTVDTLGWIDAAPGAEGLPGGGPMGGMIAVNVEGSPVHLAWS